MLFSLTAVPQRKKLTFGDKRRLMPIPYMYFNLPNTQLGVTAIPTQDPCRAGGNYSQSPHDSVPPGGDEDMPKQN